MIRRIYIILLSLNLYEILSNSPFPMLFSDPRLFTHRKFMNFRLKKLWQRKITRNERHLLHRLTELIGVKYVQNGFWNPVNLFVTCEYILEKDLLRFVTLYHSMSESHFCLSNNCFVVTPQCNECHKAFNQANSLKIHMLKHTGDRPYQCPFCSTGFSQRGNHVHYTLHYTFSILYINLATMYR